MPPIAIAAIGIGLSAAGTIAGAVGHKQAANAAMDAANFNASAALEQSATAETQQRLKDRMVLGRARALVGSSGVELAGSPLDVMAENARQAEMNALIIRRGGQINARSDILAGQAGQASQNTQAATTILTGGATVAQNTYGLIRTAK